MVNHFVPLCRHVLALAEAGTRLAVHGAIRCNSASPHGYGIAAGWCTIRKNSVKSITASECTRIEIADMA
jgi:hypothetical protein